MRSNLLLLLAVIFAYFNGNISCDPIEISKCCPQGEFLSSDEEYKKECIKQPLDVYNDLRRYHTYLRDFNLTNENPCDRYVLCLKASRPSYL